MLVQLDNVTKRFGAVEALTGVSFGVSASEIIALLGPNGAGKTTAIAIMLGLRRPTAGQASLFGLDPRDERARAACGVMLQESGLPGFLRVREIVDLFRSYYPRPKPTGELLALSGLTEKAGALVHALSGGQKQRLYFALAWPATPSCSSWMNRRWAWTSKVGGTSGRASALFQRKVARSC
ncbi:MAG: ABC transporter ATP-binding protein [Candidatus Eremiobacteraeota bacterium]|nr:ABC transporter ATP-binding protein [Candidatus Eremiobacteraeota bacterium]